MCSRKIFSSHNPFLPDLVTNYQYTLFIIGLKLRYCDITRLQWVSSDLSVSLFTLPIGCTAIRISNCKYDLELFSKVTNPLKVAFFIF